MILYIKCNILPLSLITISIFLNGEYDDVYIINQILLDNADKEFFSIISDVISMEYDKEFLFKYAKGFSKYVNLDKQFKRAAKRTYDIEYINSQIKRASDFYNMIIAENNRRIKQSKKDYLN